MIRGLLTLSFIPLVVLGGGWEERRFVATVDEDGVQRVRMRAGSYYYDPNYIVVRRGIPVEIVIVRESAFTPHNIVLEMPGLSIREELDPQEEVRIRFTPTETGKFEFYCDKKFLFFPSHREKGMWGILEVVD
jgi:plastocyanin domain-containing protein